MRNALRWAALALAGLVVAGCGGSGSDDAAPAGEEPTASSAPAAEEEVPATVDTGAATLRATLTGLLQEHVYLAGAVTDATLNGSPEGATAASATLDRNSQALANAFGNVYGPEAGDAFLEGWRGHIANFADYAAGRGTGDTARADAARDALDRYAADFGANVSSASEDRLPADALAEELETAAALVRGEGEDRFGRTFFEAELAPPYAAVKVVPALFHTQGGLVVDEHARVTREDGSVIEGLYASGGAAEGISGHGAAGYLAGNGLVPTLGQAYLAADHLAGTFPHDASSHEATPEEGSA